MAIYCIGKYIWFTNFIENIARRFYESIYRFTRPDFINALCGGLLGSGGVRSLAGFFPLCIQ